MMVHNSKEEITAILSSCSKSSRPGIKELIAAVLPSWNPSEKTTELLLLAAVAKFLKMTGVRSNLDGKVWQ